MTRFENCLNFQNARAIIFPKQRILELFSVSSCIVTGLDRGTPGPPPDQTTHWVTDVLFASCRSPKVLCIYSMLHRAILQQWKWMQLNEHWTTSVHKALPAKGIQENLKVCFPNISVRLNLTGTKPQFAEIFRYYITEAEIIQNRGFRSTLKIWEFWGKFWGIETFYRSKFSPATGVTPRKRNSRDLRFETWGSIFWPFFWTNKKKFPGVTSAPFMVPDLQLPRHQAHPLRNNPV